MGGGGAAGGGGSGAGPAATQYMPQAQPQADTAYQGIVSSLFPYANNPSSSPAGQAYGTLNPYANQLANQDLINQGSQGSQNAYNNYLTSVYPAAQNLGSLIPGGAINSYIQAQNNPYTNQAIGSSIDASNYAGNQALGSAIGGQNLTASAPNYQQWGAGTGNTIQSLMSPLLSGTNVASGNINNLAPYALGTGTNAQGAINALAPYALGTGTNAQGAINALAPYALGSGTNAQGAINALAPGALATGGATQQAIQNAMVPLQGLSSQVLNTAFDPQQALYNRTQQQVVDQARAASAAAGLSGSPYGAGVENQATENFNIDWQNQQLQRQATGAQTGTAIQNAIAQMIGQGGAAAQQGTQLAGNLYGQGLQAGLSGQQLAGNLYGQGAQTGLSGQQLAGNLYGQGAQTGFGGQQLAGNLYAQGYGDLLSGLTAGGNLGALGSQVTNQGATTAASLLGSGLGLGQGATNLAATGGALPQNTYYGGLQSGTAVQNAIAQLAQSGLNIGTQGAQGLSTFAGQPYSSLGTAINNILTPGLSNAAQLGQQQFQLPQQVLQDLQSYLGLGQAASLNSGYLGNLGLQQTAQALSGVGSALGGVNSLFGGGSSGSSGLLGGSGGLFSAGGLLGSQGPLFGTAADASIAAGGPPLALDAGAAAAGGGGFDLGSILGLGFLGL